MPRAPQVQRTMPTTLATVLCLDLRTTEPFEATIRIPRSYSTEQAMLKAIRPALETSDIKVVHVIASEKQTVKCTMTEQEYLDSAKIIEIIEKE